MAVSGGLGKLLALAAARERSILLDPLQPGVVVGSWLETVHIHDGGPSLRPCLVERETVEFLCRDGRGG